MPTIKVSANGEAALEHYTEVKTVTIKLAGPAAPGGG